MDGAREGRRAVGYDNTSRPSARGRVPGAFTLCCLYGTAQLTACGEREIHLYDTTVVRKVVRSHLFMVMRAALEICDRSFVNKAV